MHWTSMALNTFHLVPQELKSCSKKLFIYFTKNVFIWAFKTEALPIHEPVDNIAVDYAIDKNLTESFTASDHKCVCH